MDEEAEQLLNDNALVRIRQLRRNPVNGNFDAAHLIEIHRYIFQDVPKYEPDFVPGGFRPAPEGDWYKKRIPPNQSPYFVIYADQKELGERLDKTLKEFGGTYTLKGLSREQFTQKITKLYGDLDYLHPFRDGNSRTLREFTRQLAHEAGFDLDWSKIKSRYALYAARDDEVAERKFPGLRGSGKPITLQIAHNEGYIYGDLPPKRESDQTLENIIYGATRMLEVSKRKGVQPGKPGLEAVKTQSREQ